MALKLTVFLGLSFVLCTGLASAQGKSGTKAESPTAKTPASKAGRCAGSKGPEAGCTGFDLTLRKTGEEDRSAQDKKPPEPTIARDVVDQLRVPEGTLVKQSQRLLMLELGRLERLLAVTPEKSPERPQLIRRLAEGYAELAALAARDKAVAEERARRARAK